MRKSTGVGLVVPGFEPRHGAFWFAQENVEAGALLMLADIVITQ
jgi:hypothetical protein